MMNDEHKEILKGLVNEYGFDKVLEELADRAYKHGDVINRTLSHKEAKIRARSYYQLAVALEPAIKSAIERGL